MKLPLQYQTTAHLYTAIALVGFILTTLALMYTYYYTDKVMYSILVAYAVPLSTALLALKGYAKAREAQQQHVNALIA